MGDDDAKAPPWRAKLDGMTRDALEALCAVREDESLPEPARLVAQRHLLEAHAEGLVPADLVPRVTGKLRAD